MAKLTYTDDAGNSITLEGPSLIDRQGIEVKVDRAAGGSMTTDMSWDPIDNTRRDEFVQRLKDTLEGVLAEGK